MAIDYLIAQKVQKIYDSGKDYPKCYTRNLTGKKGVCTVSDLTSDEISFLCFDDKKDLDLGGWLLLFSDLDLLHFLDSKELYVSVYPILNNETLQYCNWCYDITSITGFQFSSSVAMTRLLATKEGILQALNLIDGVHS